MLYRLRAAVLGFVLIPDFIHSGFAVPQVLLDQRIFQIILPQKIKVTCLRRADLPTHAFNVA